MGSRVRETTGRTSRSQGGTGEVQYNPAPTTAPLVRVAVSCHGPLQTVRQSAKDDYDKFSLPTGSGLREDILEGGSPPFITDVEFGRSGSQCFSSDEMEC